MNKNDLCGDKQEISPRGHVRAILSTYDVSAGMSLGGVIQKQQCLSPCLTFPNVW